jgi:hypothetical protein
MTYSIHINGADAESAERILEGIEKGVELEAIEVEEVSVSKDEYPTPDQEVEE